MTVIRNSPAPLVKHEYHRADIKADLQKLGFRVPFWGCTVHTLKNMPVTEYKVMLRLLDRISSYFTKVLYYDEPVPLILPWVRELRAIKIDRIISSAEALAQVKERCVVDKRGWMVDLSILPWIYQKYATKSKINLPEA